MANKLTLNKLKRVLDIHVEEERNFLIVCDKPLAVYISEYLDEEYDIVDEDEDLDSDLFYVSLWFYQDGMRFYVECAKGHSGYKEVDTIDNQFVDYFIQDCTMSEEEVDKYLLGDATWSWFEIIEDNETDCDGDCENCELNEENELTERDKVMIDIIERFAYEIETEDMCECGCTLRNKLSDLLHLGMEIGYRDAKEECEVGNTYNVSVNVDGNKCDKVDTDKFFNTIVENLKKNGMR
jgi:hypothetical protein